MNFIFATRIQKTFMFSFLKTNYRLNALFRRVPVHNSRSFSSNQFLMDNINNLRKDVLLYTYEKPKLFKFLTFFGPAQLAIWVFYAGFMFTNLKDIAASNMKTEEALTNRSFWKRINLGETKYRIITTSLCLGIGVFTSVICFALPMRIVRELTLCKGGNVASVVTYGFFGKTLKQMVPLQNLSCHISRQQAKSYIAIKIKKKKFYYLVDSKGQFHQPTLFDYTVGTKRTKAY